MIMFIIDLPARGDYRGTTRYFASLGIPLVNTVTNAGPATKPLGGRELKGSTRPTAEWIGKQETYLLITYRAQLHHRIVTR